ncbi:hypothetical protein OPIT5_14695 [Opitutaceae bacterium TAV5]|nr:hypothetical protein OPIT5_14695 [Opitutaceae bacterium TAV5]
MTGPSFDCDVLAPDQDTVRYLKDVAKVCARDVGVNLCLKPATGHDGVPAGGLFTLHLSPGQAVSQHAVWCLACRLACFCPDARVSVLVAASPAFAAGVLPPPDEGAV